MTWHNDPVIVGFLGAVGGTLITAEDQPIVIRLAEGAEIIEYRTIALPQPGFGDITEIENDTCKLDLHVKLLNPRDW